MGINGFSYSRVFSDGSRAELWNNSDALQHTFLDKKYIVDTYTPDNYRSDERYVFLPNKIENATGSIKKRYEKQLLDQKHIFNHDNCFMIINKTNFICEYFIFYTPNKFESAINFYLNKLDELEKFSKNFKDQSRELIKIVDKEKIIKPWRKGYSDVNKITIIDFSKKFDKKINIKLTNKEMQIAAHIINGKTAKQSASLLNISVRTAESHIENIKNKFFCNRKGDLIVKLIKSKIIDDCI